MKQKLILFIACLFTATGIWAQNTVSGTVVDEEDYPVIGATVVVKGSNPMMGTVTDVDGKFSFANVPSQYKTLQVSYVGMKTMDVAAGRNIKVTLVSDAKSIDEVVVTALGINRAKKSLGYAQQEVKAADLTQAAPVSITSALTGKVAGTQINTFGGTVGASSVISIRGNSSLSSDQQPLIVVDGVPISNSANRSGDGYYTGVDYGSGLNDINVEDIESIDVLKGGAAALYGMRAANGVILITTKNGGKKGGTKISYDGGVTFDQVANIPLLQNSYGQGHDADEYHYDLYNDGSYSSYKDWAENSGYGYAYGDGAGGGTNDDWDESWGPRLDIGIKTTQFNSNGEATEWKSNPNNVRDFFQTGVTQNHMVSVSNVSEKANVRASLSYRGQTGTVPNTDQERYGGMINSEVKLNSKVWMNANANFTHTNSDNLIGQGYGSNNPMISLLEWTGRQVDVKALKEIWDEKDAAGNYNYANWISVFHVNPYFNVYENTNSYVKDRFFGKGALFFQPTDWLKFEGRIGVDNYTSKSTEHVYYNADYVNGYFDQRVIASTEFNADFLAYFNKKWDKLSFDGVLGANYRDVVYSYDELECDGLTVLGVYTAANANPIATMDHSWIRSNSVYANASLGYADQLYLDLSARNDWSSTINDPIFYPSVSVSWLPFETFGVNNDTFSFLKLRGGFAEVGNATSAYRNSYYYYASSAGFNGTTLMYKSKSYPNFDLKPERAQTLEFGFELGLFQDRLHLDVAYYDKSTFDQILYVSTAYSSGITSKLINAGQIDNNGIEVQLRADIIKNKNFNWNTTFNFSKDVSKIVSLADGLDKYDMGWTWGISTTAKVGDPWGDITGSAYERTEDGAIILDEYGNGTELSNQVIGNVTPDALLSWRHDFSFLKNWNAGFMLDMRLGGDLWSQTMSHAYCAGSAAITAENGVREKACVPGKDISTQYTFVQWDDATQSYVPATCEVAAQDWFEWQFTANEVYIFDGSFLKLREAYIGYDVPKQWLKKTKFIDAAKISFVGNNLALLWVHKSNTMRIDPECGGVNSNSYGIGLEQSSTPSCRSYGFKVNLTF